MQTLHPKVLPVTRLLLHECKTKGQSVRRNGTAELRVTKLNQDNDRFEFYQISDGHLLARIAVLKENNDSIVPYQYYDAFKELPIKFVNFTKNGTAYFQEQIDEHDQHIFCNLFNHWLQLLNRLFNIV